MESELFKIEKLQTSEQYSVWKFQVTILLNASGLFEFVDGLTSAPVKAEREEQTAFDSRLLAWKRSDSKAQRIIATSIGSTPLRHIVNCHTAAEMWVKLKAVYEQTSKASIHLLLQRFYSFEKDSEDDVATHISKLQNIVRQLRDIGEEVSESMIITKVLMTLPESFKHFFCAWESTAKEQQTLENLTSRLVMEEARMSTHSTSTSVALVAKQKARKPNQRAP